MNDQEASKHFLLFNVPVAPFSVRAEECDLLQCTNRFTRRTCLSVEEPSASRDWQICLRIGGGLRREVPGGGPEGRPRPAFPGFRSRGFRGQVTAQGAALD